MRGVLIVASLVGSVGASAPAAAGPGTLDELTAGTRTLATEVSRLRDLKVKRAVPHDVVDRGELARRMRALLDKDRDASTERLAQLVCWGLLPARTDYDTLVSAIRTDAVAGYYDLGTKRLVISRDANADLGRAEMVIAHELVHGLQDQAFDLAAFERGLPGEADAALARRALVEGDAMALTIELALARGGTAAPWSNPDATATVAKSFDLPGAHGLDGAPLALRDTMTFPYRAGLDFVAALRRRQPWSAVDAAYRKPPRSTEQVLHPERYLAGDEPVPVAIAVPAALASYQVISSSTWGEHGFDVFVRAHGVDAAVATIAATGWGGDRVVVLAPQDAPTKLVGLARFDWDSEADAIEATEAVVKAFEELFTGSVVTRGATRTQWTTRERTAAWVERKGPALVMAIGVPGAIGDAVLAQQWAATGSGKAAKAIRAARVAPAAAAKKPAK